MILIFIALIVISCVNLKFSKSSFIYDNLSKSNPNSTCIKGIFAIIIFISHCMSYFTVQNIYLDAPMTKVTTIIGQLMVTVFFFYSGYGIMQSYNENPEYIKSFPKNRILKTIVHFDVAILLFLVMNLILARDYSPLTILLAFTGYTSIGNSNWFMFAIFVLYIFTYISFSIFKNKKIGLIVVTMLSLTYIFVMSKIVNGNWWYDTILTYPFGLFYGYYKTKIERLITNSNKYYIFILSASLISFIVLWFVNAKFNFMSLTYNLLSIVFVFILILVTYKIQFNNKILVFLGKHSFNIYILQRLPMIILARTTLLKYNLLFALTSLVLTIIISIGFEFINKKIDSLLFKKKSNETIVIKNS